MVQRLMQSSNTLDLSGQPAGLYILQIKEQGETLHHTGSEGVIQTETFLNLVAGLGRSLFILRNSSKFGVRYPIFGVRFRNIEQQNTEHRISK